MLVNLKEILKIAEEREIAIGAFNTPDITCLRAIIGAAEEMNEPVIIMHAQIHEEMEICKLEEIAPAMISFAKAATVPVCVHLDHGTDIEYIKRGLDLGFTSVMYDGSVLGEEKNISNTIEVVKLAAEKGASVEAELGSMGAREGTGETGECIYTEPDEAVEFVAKTGVDALACSFGTAHGFYKDIPKLDFDRVSKIHSLIDVPIVMHGGSGVAKEDYIKVIKCGVRKVNYYTYMDEAGGKAISGKTYKQFHDALKDAELAMKNNIKNAIKIFTNKE